MYTTTHSKKGLFLDEFVKWIGVFSQEGIFIHQYSFEAFILKLQHKLHSEYKLPTAYRFTLLGETLSGESAENFEKWRKFRPKKFRPIR